MIPNVFLWVILRGRLFCGENNLWFFKKMARQHFSQYFFIWSLKVMCILLYCLLLCKPNCCRESFNAVQGTVYLGHGWFVPPHWNASKRLWMGVWYFVFFLSQTSLRNCPWHNNSISCFAFRNTWVVQGLKTHQPNESQFTVSTYCVLGHAWFYQYSSQEYAYINMHIRKHDGSLAARKWACLLCLTVRHEKVKEKGNCAVPAQYQSMDCTQTSTQRHLRTSQTCQIAKFLSHGSTGNANVEMNWPLVILVGGKSVRIHVFFTALVPAG